MPSTDCGLVPGDVIVIDPETRERLRDCLIPEGVTFRIFYAEERPMDPVAPEPAVSLPAVPDALPGAEIVAPTETIATTEPAPDLTKIVEATGGDPTLTLALGLLAVVGGAAGWKFWTQFSAQKHEQQMKKLDLEAQHAGLNGAQPPPCQAKQLEVDKKLEALDRRQTELARKFTTLAKFDGPSPDELDERLVKLEKAAKKARETAP